MQSTIEDKTKGVEHSWLYAVGRVRPMRTREDEDGNVVIALDFWVGTQAIATLREIRVSAGRSGIGAAATATAHPPRW